MKRKLKSIFNSQAGFTLIEVLTAVVITGIISLGVAVSSAQLINQTARNRDYAAATRNTTNAIYWMTHDALMSQSIEGYEDFPASGALSLAWTSWDSATCSVNYTLANGTLKRTSYNGVSVSSMIVAENINPAADKTYCVLNNGVLTLTVTSSVGQGSRTVNVTKTKEISSRPRL